MKRLLPALALLLTLGAAVPARAELRAGAANADLTPPIGTPMFAYTARSNVAGGRPEEVALQIVADPDSGLYAKTFAASRGIHTRPRARTIVLDTGQRKVALVQVDLGGIPYALVQRVEQLIGDSGIPIENVLIAATHTHSSTGPIWPTESTGYALLGGDAFDPRVFDHTARAIARSIVVADSYRVPAKLGIATTRITNASRNRNFEPFLKNEDVPKDEKAAREASIDPQMTVIRVDEADGRPIGVWSNFAIHETSFGDENLLFSGDNAGYTERIVEKAIRDDARKRGKAARRPEAVVNVWTNSNEGDISPDGGTDKLEGESLHYSGNDFTGAHMAGLKVARGMLRAWRRAGRAMTSAVELGSERRFLAFDGEAADGEPVGPNAVLGAGGVVADDGTCAPFDDAAGPGQGQKQFLLGGPGDSLVPGTQPITLMRIGALGIAAVPSEVTKQMGLRMRAAVKEASGGGLSDVILAGLTNGYSSYTSTPEEYDACHYEGSFTLFGRRQGPLYRDALASVSKAVFGGEAYKGDPAPSYPASEAGEFPQPDPTPEAGTTVDQSGASVKRYGRVKMSWNGGHPSIDAPRARALVRTERMTRRGWKKFTTDDSFYDILERDPESDVWTTTLQTTGCMPLGRYRFLIRGRADRGNGVEEYRIESRAFRLEPIRDLAPTLVVRGRRATVTALYPDPGTDDALLALPRRVRSGSAVLGVKRHRGREKRVRARLTRDRLAFSTRVPRRAKVRVIRVRDACGNTGPRA